MELDIYQQKTTFFIVVPETKMVLYTKSGEIFFSNHNEAYKKLEEMLHKNPVQKWVMVSGKYLEREFTHEYMKYAKICEGTYNGEE